MFLRTRWSVKLFDEPVPETTTRESILSDRKPIFPQQRRSFFFPSQSFIFIFPSRQANARSCEVWSWNPCSVSDGWKMSDFWQFVSHRFCSFKKLLWNFLEIFKTKTLRQFNGIWSVCGSVNLKLSNNVGNTQTSKVDTCMHAHNAYCWFAICIRQDSISEGGRLVGWWIETTRPHPWHVCVFSTEMLLISLRFPGHCVCTRHPSTIIHRYCCFSGRDMCVIILREFQPLPPHHHLINNGVKVE